MKRLSTLFSLGISLIQRYWFQPLQFQRLFAVVLVGMMVLASNVRDVPRSESLSEAVRQRVEQTDPSNRPKTTGEFLDEARGDVPLDERLHNITRDSAEAFKQLGRQIPSSTDERDRSLSR